jgi:cytochrome-b5 reductase
VPSRGGGAGTTNAGSSTNNDGDGDGDNNSNNSNNNSNSNSNSNSNNNNGDAAQGSSSGSPDGPSQPGSPGIVAALVPGEVTYFPLAARTRVSHNAELLTFELPDPRAQLGLAAGQHIAVCITVAGEVVRRPYTPVTPPGTRGTFQLLVKVYPTGVVSRYLAGLAVGDAVAFSGPGGRFVHVAGAFRRLGMVCGGSGVTPMLQIMRAIAADPADRTEVSLIYANVTEADIMLRAELDEVVAALGPDRARAVYYVLNEPPAEGWQGGTGFVSAEMIREHMPPPADDTKLLFCGPLPMVKAMQDHAKALGYARKHYYRF